MIKRVFSFFLALVMALAILPLTATQANAEYTLVTDRDVVDGSDYTESSAMAEKLNEIFDGNASIYADKTCTIPVDTFLGTSPVKNNGVSMYVGAEGQRYLSTGTSCFVYANGVYYTLFGESTGSGEAGENSEKLNLSKTGSRRASYSNFKAWGVRQGVGALIRASGHSMILLDYNEDTITILDGNSDGRGRVSICTRSWEQFSEYYYIQYIIQPKDSHYADLYACGSCGEDTFWFVDSEGTLTISGNGEVSACEWEKYSNEIKKVVVGEGITGINNSMFYNCNHLNQIVFTGAAPVLASNTFFGTSATVQYPAAKRGWNEDMLKRYGGNLIWVPYGMTELQITSHPRVTVIGDHATVSLNAEGDGLTYCWYVKNEGEDLYVKTSASSSEYSTTLGEDNRNQKVRCVVRDQYGNFVISESSLLCADNALVPYI